MSGHSRDARIPVLWTAVLGLATCSGSIDLLHIYISHRLGFESLNARDTLVFVVWWSTYILLLIAALYLARRLPLVPQFRPRRFALHLLAAAGLAYIHTLSNALVCPPTFYPGLDKLQRTVYLARMNFPIDFISYWTIVGVAYAFYFYASIQDEKIAEAQLLAKAEQLQKSLVESRLNALRSQLNPHFLFNTLNVISTLVLKGNTASANRAIARLSMLLRLCLNEGGPQLVPLASELEFVNSYLEIQQLLLGDRLAIERDVAPSTAEAHVPRMLLQPIIENAVVHGIATQQGNGRIRIQAARDHEFLQISVIDSGGGFTHGVPERFGVGLSTTSARLQQLYGNAGKLTFGRTSDGGASISIQIPFRTSTSQRLEVKDSTL